MSPAEQEIRADVKNRQANPWAIVLNSTVLASAPVIILE
jgi:hypothetical protein